LNTTQDGQNLLSWIQNALIYMVELDYDEVRDQLEEKSDLMFQKGFKLRHSVPSLAGE
jgi:hypothetical protein